MAPLPWTNTKNTTVKKSREYSVVIQGSVKVLDIWSEILEDRGVIDDVYRDLKNVFDKVPHQ